ncbi:hypothetical protein GCM10028815_07130 [Mariniluteicoccus flavus]
MVSLGLGDESWLRERINDTGLRWNHADPRVNATLWWYSASSVIVFPLVAGVVMTGIAPRPDPTRGWLRPDGYLGGLATTGPSVSAHDLSAVIADVCLPPITGLADLAGIRPDKHGPLAPRRRLMPIAPFLVGGAFDTPNMVDVWDVELMGHGARLAGCVRRLPDGTRIEATSLQVRATLARRVPVSQLTPEDLRLLLGQQIDPELVMPIAVGRLRTDPLMEGDLYEGDVLEAALGLPDALWERRTRPERVSCTRSASSSVLRRRRRTTYSSASSAPSSADGPQPPDSTSPP